MHLLNVQEKVFYTNKQAKLKLYYMRPKGISTKNTL